MLNLSTHQLNVFLAAAETLNFTQAAQRLQVTQPSVSQHIQALEEHFGLPLFLRAGRSVELTEAGLTLIPLARELVSLSIHIEETMQSQKGEVVGHLSVSCCTTAGRYILPRLLANFHRSFPQVHATCQVLSCEQAVEMLAEGRVQLAITGRPVPLPEVEYRQFSCERVVLIVPLTHPWAGRQEISPTELINADFILPDESSETHQIVQAGLLQAGISMHQLRSMILLDNLEAIALSVQEGLGVAFVPETVVTRLVQNLVCPVEVRGMNLVQDIYMGRNLHRPATNALKAFWEFSDDCHNF